MGRKSYSFSGSGGRTRAHPVQPHAAVLADHPTGHLDLKRVHGGFDRLDLDSSEENAGVRCQFYKKLLNQPISHQSRHQLY